jgi:hypothetical protein
VNTKLIAVLGTGVLALAVAVAPGVASSNVKKVDSSITLNFTRGSGVYAPYTQDTFSGHVKAKKGCKKHRTVDINNADVSGKTDENGDYSIAVGIAGRGTYTATVEKKERKKDNGTRIVCKKATSNAVTVG